MTPPYLTQMELAARWRISPRTLERWRWAGEGLAFVKVGARILYSLSDVEAHEAAQTRGTSGMAFATAPAPSPMNEFTFAPPKPGELSPAEAFVAWPQHAGAGDVCAYHHGLLAVDRDPTVSKLSAPARQALTAVADLALAFAEAGRVLLVQERLGGGVFRYLAVIASRQEQAARPMSRPVALIPQVCISAIPAAVEDLA